MEKLYSGNLIYRDVKFRFVFNGNELHLLPPEGDIYEKMHWRYNKLTNGCYQMLHEQIIIEEDYLIGDCDYGCAKIIFIFEQTYVGYNNNVLVINVDYFITCNNSEMKFSRLEFSSKEINHIYPTNKALDNFNYDYNGVLSITTNSFENTTNKGCYFKLDGKDVCVKFLISRKFSNNIEKPILSFSSVMQFSFEETDNYFFLLKLCRIAKEFISFLCFRKNTPFSNIILCVKNEDKYRESGEFHIFEEVDEKDREISLKKRKYIKIEYLNGTEGKILDDIANGKLYTRHLHENGKKQNIITPSSFVMITAAFEYLFNKNFDISMIKSARTIKAENNVVQTLETLRAKSSGKTKEIYNRLIKNIKYNSLKDKIIFIGKEYKELIEFFGKYLYSINNRTYNINKISDRLAQQRNNYAHGNLEQEFIGESVLDVILLERIVYIMQLKEYNVEDINIKKALNDLFHCSLRL